MTPKRANPLYMTSRPPGALSDRELVLAFQAGDARAYDELYARHRGRVDRICHRLLQNRTDVEEAAQETFLKAFQALPRFNGQFQVGAWLARIATNVCVDHLRGRSRSHLVALPDNAREQVEIGPEDLVVGDHPRVDVAIKEVSPLHATALQMRAVEGMSHREIAGRLGMTPNQVKALLHRARSSFKKAWDQAQGWLLAPLIKLRMDKTSNVSQASSNLAVLSPETPAFLEKAAASVLIMVAALSGSGGAVHGSGVAPPPAAVSARRAPGTDVVSKGALALGAGHAVGATDARPVAVAELAVPQVTLPAEITAQVDGRGDTPGKRPAGDHGDDGGDKIPLTVKDTRREAREVVAKVQDALSERP